MIQRNGLNPENGVPALTTQHEFEAIAEFLGESPETVIPLHMLKHDACEVVCVGSPHAPEGVVIQSTAYPEEPIAFGEPKAIASILPMLSGWTCINVPADVADALRDAVQRTANAAAVRSQDDIYHILESPAPIPQVPDVRLLSADDRELFRTANAELDGVDEDWLFANLAHGYVAGAIRGGQIVSIAHTFALTKVYADLGVRTMTRWRRQGLATATSAIVAQAIQRGDRTPVWSCGGHNIASLAVAARLGFREVSRRVYLIPEQGSDPSQ